MLTAPVNKIIDSSIVDGPGNRTAVFFQSCNFNCRFCHNPETIHMCQNCGFCVSLCPVSALSVVNGKVMWEEEKCVGCDTCIKNCPHNASAKIKNMTVKEVFHRVEANMPFIRGVTVSGGECTLQAEFVTKLFQLAKEKGLGTLLDSNGSYDFQKHPEILEYADGVMLDIKATDNEKHRWLCDAENEMVLKNAVYLAKIHKLEEIRTVIIPQKLNNEETIQMSSELLKEYLKNQDIRYKLIRYRHYGVREKYRDFTEPDDSYMEELKELAIRCGFRNVIVI